MKTMELGSAPPFFWSRSTVELLELGVIGGENLEWSCFFGSGAAWSSPKHALKAINPTT
jgi:hypothetical protein